MDNISRSGLVNMCRYMGVPPFGNDNFLRYCLRSKLRAITQASLVSQNVCDCSKTDQETGGVLRQMLRGTSERYPRCYPCRQN